MTFDPKTDKFPYPERTDAHYLPVTGDRGIVFDTNYPYVDRSRSFLFRQALVRIVLNTIVFPLCRVRMGLRIEGRENLKKHRDTLQKGVLSVSNHVHMWDYIAIMRSIRPFRPHHLSWAKNVNGKDGTLVRLTGGIPIPDSDVAATRKYLKDVRQLLQKDGGWLHVYAEGSMWEYYAPIRPFKRGAAHIACDCGKPVVPLAFSYREPGTIRRKLFRQIALFTIRIGEPIFPNEELNPKERELDLAVRLHDEVCRLAGIKPEYNLYPAVFHDSKRIDYYTTIYGVGYKGSN